ncbi:DNA recombination protein RmuC [Helicobacter aurati]|uniref:DNA recombination protein RmuC n=1 Tax=Helicobacter aurati TaxID=137778 RepID=A0A3D8J5H6_9HELI|nr:DNA recombination protein RmuC [Helicobacter aurati]RDU72500.1 DNA recombination protein RmuC [Helicobacter aurati]
MQQFILPSLTFFVSLSFIMGILCYLQRKKINSFREILKQKEEYLLAKNLITQELQLKERHIADRLQCAQEDNERLRSESLQILESLKQEYENKLQAKENTLRESYTHYIAKIQEIQDAHKTELQEKIREALLEQEEKLNTQYHAKQEEIAKTLTIEREKQEALMTQRFYEISNSLLEQKGQQFQEKQELSLKPLTEEIIRFKHEIAQNTKENQEKQTSLITEIKLLKDANMLISKEANNLATVMKGGAKQQGQWGEVVLERILENSGLEKDREYHLQVTLKNEQQQNLRPDAIVQLPNNRFVIIDSKVSLNAYLEYSNSEDSKQKEQYLKSHLESIKLHIKNLTAKTYQDYIDGQKLDFMIMFLPSEGAYNEILREDMKIFMDAYQKGIIISAPTTLMVILRLINYLWKNEARDKNTEKILGECEKLIKKFNGFKDSMEKIEVGLQNALSAYGRAGTQLNGRGSLSSYINNLNNYMSKIAQKNSLQDSQVTLENRDTQEQNEALSQAHSRKDSHIA